MQPYRNSHFNIPEWVAAGYDEAFITSYLNSEKDSYNHPNAAIEPRIPGIFQYYSIAEDELAKIFAGQMTAQQGADNIAAAWEKLTDQIGRDNQIKLSTRPHSACKRRITEETGGWRRRSRRQPLSCHRSGSDDKRRHQNPAHEASKGEAGRGHGQARIC